MAVHGQVVGADLLGEPPGQQDVHVAQGGAGASDLGLQGPQSARGAEPMAGQFLDRQPVEVGRGGIRSFKLLAFLSYLN